MRIFILVTIIFIFCVNCGFSSPNVINFVANVDTDSSSVADFNPATVPIGMVVTANAKCEGGEGATLIKSWEISPEIYSSWTYNGDAPVLTKPDLKLSTINFYWATPGVKAVKVQYERDFAKNYEGIHKL